MNITHLDHLVLTVANIEITLNFYQRVLGMEKQTFASNRVALKFGNQKINLHQAGNEPEPKATMPLPGSADLCFVAQSPLSDAMQHVRDCGVDILEGPVARTGAMGPMASFYFRDPDLNLIELCHY
ncbi:MAG: VOC family protein [Gammaproteobacteria bacterium]|nr:VOC family protein [Gammaproteobacteria bacterium]MCF6258680.1 VOC family protein [Gammaproteobacteria bacterium]